MAGITGTSAPAGTPDEPAAGQPGLGGRTQEDVRQILADQIAAGRLRPGQRLGAERPLAAALGVSRATLRQALAVLEENDLVRRVPGRGGGTFVIRAKIERDLSRVVGAHALRLRRGDLVIDLVRIRLADGSPISVEHAMLPADRFPGLLELPLGGSV